MSDLNSTQMTKKELRARKKELRKIKPGRLERREARMGLLFIIPWFIGAAVFLAYPLGMSMWYALNNIRIVPKLGLVFKYVGTGNFTEILLADPDFPTQLVEYVISTAISAPIIVVFALIIAMMLNQNIKGKGFFLSLIHI